MPKFVLMFEDQVLQDVPVGMNPVSIGRLPDNVVVIDNPAVSGHHARVMVQGGQYLLEDLQSTNGTFVNQQRVTRHVLRDGDMVLVGKHKLIFQHTGKEEAWVEPAPAAAAPVPDIGGTVFLDTKAHKEMLAKMKAQAPAGPEPPTVRMRPGGGPAPAAAQQAVLTVVSGSTDQPQYVLDSPTALIGSSKTARVRLKGWFKPDVAASISRKKDTYVLTPLKGETKLNNQRLTGPCQLEDGDVLEVSGVSLQFNLQ